MGTATVEKDAPQYEGWKVTREQYLDLKDDGFKYDMVDGVLQLSPSGFLPHGIAQTRMAARMLETADKSGQGIVTVETDVLLPDGGDVVRPDVTFVVSEKINEAMGHIHAAPDIAVEVLSKNTRDRDLGVKAERYLKNGVQEYWILDPQDKKIMVWNNRGDKWDKREGDVLKSELLEGFEVKAGEVFG